MIQLGTSDSRSATRLPSPDNGSDEPSTFPKTYSGALPIGWTTGSDAVDCLPYVSPPPMRWPRIFPGL